MKVLAITDRRYSIATMLVVRGTGARMLQCPPHDAVSITSDVLSGNDIIYIDLHGQKGSAYLWAGKEQDLPALAVSRVAASDMHKTVVFATSCHLPDTPFMRAFDEAGAAVIAGDGVNYGSRVFMSGAQILARALLLRLMRGDALDIAIDGARNALAKHATRHEKAKKDALEFKVFGAKNEQTEESTE